MPDGSTRRERFLKRQARYRRRMRRRARSWPTVDHYHWGDTGRKNHPNGPIEFVGDGRRQQSLHQLLVQPVNGLFPRIPPIPYTLIRGKGYKKPPHLHQNYHFPIGGLHHESWPLYNFFNNPIRKCGHKIDRQDGYSRRLWGAAHWNYMSKKIWGGTGWYPSWDPLHRTPVDDTPPWEG